MKENVLRASATNTGPITKYPHFFFYKSVDCENVDIDAWKGLAYRKPFHIYQSLSMMSWINSEHKITNYLSNCGNAIVEIRMIKQN